GAEMVILAYANRKTTLDAEQAQVLTQKQSEAVRDFLKQAGAVYKKYWVFPRKVRLHGFGLDTPPVAEKDNPPGPALGILVFVPEKKKRDTRTKRTRSASESSERVADGTVVSLLPHATSHVCM